MTDHSTPYRTEQRDGHEIHFSVGAIIIRDGKMLLIDRVKPPLGMAGVAGHIDVGETPEEAIKREVIEESGLEPTSATLVGEEFIPWNDCSKGVSGHYWYVYGCQTTGAVTAAKAEVKAFGWYTAGQLRGLKLEPVWDYWFKKLQIIKEG